MMLTMALSAVPLPMLSKANEIEYSAPMLNTGACPGHHKGRRSVETTGSENSDRFLRSITRPHRPTTATAAAIVSAYNAQSAGSRFWDTMRSGIDKPHNAYNTTRLLTLSSRCQQRRAAEEPAHRTGSSADSLVAGGVCGFRTWETSQVGDVSRHRRHRSGGLRWTWARF